MHISMDDEVIEHLALGHDPDGDPPSCCTGAAVYGPGRCTCWREVYDLDQAEPDLDPDARVTCRPKMCADCAFRAGSPERQGDDRYVGGDPDEWERIDSAANPFFCHDGMRRLIGYRHLDGTMVTIEELMAGAPHLKLVPDAYKPPIRDGVAYQADGSPGVLCAGWTARRLQEMQT